MRSTRRWSSQAGFGALFLVTLAACGTTPVAVSLSDEDATRVVASLSRAGIPASKRSDANNDNHFVVAVAQTDASTALQLLADEDLPPRSSASLESVSGGSLVPSPRVEQARLLAAQANELERSLRSIDGVVSARVHLASPSAGVQPSINLDLAKPTPSSASVLLKYRGEQPPVSSNDIQKLIAGAVAGLSAESVNVIAVRAATPVQSPSWVMLGPVVVARGSVGVARIVVASLLVACILLAGALVWSRLTPQPSRPRSS